MTGSCAICSLRDGGMADARHRECQSLWRADSQVTTGSEPLTRDARVIGRARSSWRARAWRAPETARPQRARAERSSRSPRSRRRTVEKLTNLLVTGLREVAVPLPDRSEVVGRTGADDLVRDLRELLARFP